MSTDIIVSYDGTPNDDDALALGRMLAQGGNSVALAYVRHSREFDPRREEVAAHDAQRRLESGANMLGAPGVERHVVVHPSTWVGLAELAGQIGASVIVFGSDYRTPPGRVSPGTTAQHLLEGGPVGVAVAPAGLRANPDAAINTILIADGAADEAAGRTAEMLAERLGATVIEDPARADLIVLGSAPGGSGGRVRVSGAARNWLAAAQASVLVVPTGTPVMQ
jgi:nucleotide-binding universal stress UspA family protein